MARPTYPSDNVDKLLLRFPPGMRDRLKAIADANGRSMNAEIIYRLELSFERPATLTMEIKHELQLAVKEFLQENGLKEGELIRDRVEADLKQQLDVATDDETATDPESDHNDNERGGRS